MGKKRRSEKTTEQQDLDRARDRADADAEEYLYSEEIKKSKPYAVPKDLIRTPDSPSAANRQIRRLNDAIEDDSKAKTA